MYSFGSIALYHNQLQQEIISCSAVVEYYLNQIEKHLHLNAYTEVYAEEALQKAKALDEARKNGVPLKKLHGVVIAIKDVICYKGHKVTAASKILYNFESIFTATAIQRLLDEDAIIIGSCNCDEFAMGSTNENSAYGKVLNALDNTKVPGGSSGGSAVALQADTCMASLGSDTGGSVRQPADFCGLIGFKPTYGRISRYGLIAYASSFDQIGIFAKCIADISLLLEVMSGPDEYDSTVLPDQYENSNLQQPEDKKYRIAYFNEALHHPSLDEEIRNKILQLIHQLKQQGHIVEPVGFDMLEYIVPAYYVLTTAEASSNLSRYDGIRFGHHTEEACKDLTEFYKRTRSEGFGREVQRRIMLGTFVLSTGYFDAYFTKAQQVRRLLSDKISAVFKDFDALLLPTSPTTAFSFNEKPSDPTAVYLSDIYTVFANLTGTPAIALPLFKHSNGMPFGVQIMSNKLEDVPLLQISKLLLQEQDF